jgi:hypothetical protein
VGSVQYVVSLLLDSIFKFNVHGSVQRESMSIMSAIAEGSRDGTVL